MRSLRMTVGWADSVKTVHLLCATINLAFTVDVPKFCSSAVVYILKARQRRVERDLCEITWFVFHALPSGTIHTEVTKCDRCVIVAFSVKPCWPIYSTSVISLAESVYSHHTLILCIM